MFLRVISKRMFPDIRGGLEKGLRCNGQGEDRRVKINLAHLN
jgi:hypothetical protein